MFHIHKISQRYDSREDRIEVAIQNESGVVVKLWMTQRLANRMLAVLVKWLPDLHEDAKLSQQSLNSSDAQSDVISKSSGEDNGAVKFDCASEEGLLKSVDMNYQQKDYALTFKWGVTGAASITMGLEQLNGFIDGMALLYRSAGWDMKTFPDNKVNTLSSKAPEFEDFLEDSPDQTHTLH